MSTISNFVKRLRDIMRNDAGINGDAQRIEQIMEETPQWASSLPLLAEPEIMDKYRK